MARKQYTDEEKARYWAEKGGKPTRSRRTTSKKKFNPATYKPTNGCTIEDSYKDGKTGDVVNKPRIWGWRKIPGGLQKLSCFLKGDGVPENPKDDESKNRYLIFVCNLTGAGSSSTATGIWDKKYNYMRIPDWDLVVKPKARKGGYFGRGGTFFKDKVK